MPGDLIERRGRGAGLGRNDAESAQRLVARCIDLRRAEHRAAVDHVGRRSWGDVDQHQPTHRDAHRNRAQGDLTAHRCPDDVGAGSKPLQNERQVSDEPLRLVVAWRVIAFAMPAKVEGEDAEVGKEEGRDAVPPASVRSASMQQEQRVSRPGWPFDDMRPSWAWLVRVLARQQKKVVRLPRWGAAGVERVVIDPSHEERFASYR